MATNNDFTSNWWMNQRTYLLRDRLDREVFAILQKDSAAQKVMDDARNQMLQDVEQERIKNLSGAALAQDGQDGQYQEILAMIRDVAKTEGFPAKAVANANVFIMGSNQINAYTYSSLRDQALDVVFYTPIIDAMSAEGLKAVAGHELGHIMSEHVLISVTLNAIFEKTGRNLIPPDEKFTFESMLRSNLREAITGLYSAMGAVEVPEKTVDWYINIARGIAARIPNDERTKQRMIKLTESILDALGSENHDVSPAGMKNVMNALNPGKDKGDDGPNPKDMKAFQKDLTRHTRSCESTADRHAIVFVGGNPLKESMAVLTGGKGANPDAIWNQVKLQTLAMEKYGMNADDIDTADHPLTPFRVGAVEGFMASYDYKIVKDPFLGLLDMTIKASRYASYLQANVDSGNGTGWREQNGLRRDEYIALAKKGAQMITDIIINEIASASNKDQQNPLANFEQFIGYFDYNTRPMGSITPAFGSLPEQNSAMDIIDLGKKGRIGDLLTSRLTALARENKGKDEKAAEAYTSALNMVNAVILTIDTTAAQQLQFRNIIHLRRGEDPETDPGGILNAAGFCNTTLSGTPAKGSATTASARRTPSTK
jgi:Zn-dependent protease with chaperone function